MNQKFRFSPFARVGQTLSSWAKAAGAADRFVDLSSNLSEPKC